MQRLSPILRVVVCQAVGALAAWGIAEAVRAAGLASEVSPETRLMFHGVVAASLGLTMRLERRWIWPQLFLPPLLGLFIGVRLPGWVPFVALALLVGFYWNAIAERVPLYLSNKRTRDALAGLLPQKEGMRAADLGAGLGGPLLTLAAARPDGEFVGCETAPLSWLVARVRIAGRPNVRLMFASLWSLDLGGFDVVYAFLSPAPMPKLYDKAAKEMKPGSILVSNSFAVPGVDPDAVVELDDRRGTHLFVYRF